MNKKYIELAEQAGFMLWGKESWNPGDVIDWSARYDKELETLCDLIVRECAYIAARAQDENMGWDISGIIKEHFGVEE